MASRAPVIFVVSDSVGETAEAVTVAAIAQFDSHDLEIRRFPNVFDERAVQHVVTEARQQPSLVVYTLILPGARRAMQELTGRHGIPAVDVMGPMLDEVARLLRREPKLLPGLVHKLDEDYFKRIEAVEFAVKYDDGKDPRGCLNADVVLLGVSRSSKTPVSMYLAHRKVKVANIPLVPEVPVPTEVYQVAHKCVGFLLDAEKLLQIRQERLRTIGLRADANYANLERILEELEYARDTYRKIGCPVIDITNKAVEETAVRVLELIQKRGTNPVGD